MISPSELNFIVVEPIHKYSLRRGKSHLESILGVATPNGWPHFPNAFSVHESGGSGPNPTPEAWPGYFFVYSPEGIIVGNGGFKGPPDETGRVEIGYEIAREHWNRGFATTAVRKLLSRAFAHKNVRAVEAHTLAEKSASNSVLKKVGMTFVEQLPNPEVGAVWRWRISAEQYQSR